MERLSQENQGALRRRPRNYADPSTPKDAFYVGVSNALLRQIRTTVDERIEKSIEFAYLRNKEIHIIGDFNIDCLKTAAYMHNASVNSTELRPVPSRHGLLRGICPTLQSRGGTFAKFALPVGRAFANPGAIPELLTRTTGSFLSECNYTEDITEKKAD